ncbi:pilus assembly protein TadG-related protein [Anaerobacillus sp. MEB173]|uniref:pilus assembly protein TadG-related protein n=1 Tax=Anaerobacillus sp. MEB173 TaxID=3383345 RepID=UPI003F927163
MLNNFLKKEDGAVIVLVAFSMSIFIGFMALVLDAGSLYLEKNRLQKIVDAAALAGAQELPSFHAKAQGEVNKTIQFNQGDLSHFSTRIQNTSIEVTANKQATMHFATVLGISEPTIQARARVDLLPIQSGIGAIPLGVQPTHNLAFGVSQTLKVSDSASGNFGAIALTGPGAKNYTTDLMNGYGFELKVGSTLSTETGNLAGPTRDGIQPRISACPNATYLNYPPGCARVVLVPIYEPVQLDQNQIKQVRVVGFASFFIESVSSTNQGAEVVGRFIQVAQSGESSPNQSNFGTYGYKLTQ